MARYGQSAHGPVHRSTRTGAGTTSVFPATLVFLCLLIAMVTQVIGDNVARAFSLVGALSIVRFRTSVRDTKDTAFVIFAVAIGMAVGADQPLLALTGMAFTLAATILYRDRPPRHPWAEEDVVLMVRLNWSPHWEHDRLVPTVAPPATVLRKTTGNLLRMTLRQDLSRGCRRLDNAACGAESYFALMS